MRTVIFYLLLIAAACLTVALTGEHWESLVPERSDHISAYLDSEGQ